MKKEMVDLEVQLNNFYIKVFKLLLIAFLIVGCQAPKQDIIQQPKVSFVAVGDNLMHQRLLDVAKTDNGYDFTSYYTNMKPYIEKASLAFVNQETILGGDELGAKGYPNFNTPEIMAKNLKDTGFDIVNGSTNHALDMGNEALYHSIKVFDQYPEIAYIGLYDSKEKRDTIKVVEKEGIKIGFLSYNQWTNEHTLPNNFCMNLFDEERIKKDVENAKEVSDIVIVSCHWGNEYDIKPNEFQKQYAKLFADLGVDVILGTHSHTLQSVEWIEGKDGHKTLVAYSLGNFISGMMEEETQLGGMLSFDLVKTDNQVKIDNVTLTPLANHYQVKNKKNVYDSRYGFTVYRLKDYTDELAKNHGLNGYQGINISIDKMKEKVKQRVSKDIHIDM